MSIGFRSKYPSLIGIETSSVCNCKCPICPLFQGAEPMQKGSRRNLFMPMDIFHKIVGEISEWEEKPSIFLNIFGEPLLDPALPEKLEILYNLDLSKYVYLQTNATLLKDRIAEAILDYKVGSLNPCLDSHIHERFEKIRVGASFVSVFDNIMNFISMRNRKASPTRIGIQHVRTAANKNDHYQVYELFKDKLGAGDVLNVTTSHYWATKSLKNNFSALINTGAQQTSFDCQTLASWLLIDSDGNSPVCYFDYNYDNYNSRGVAGKPDQLMFNVRNKELTDIWHDPWFAQLYERIKSGKELPLRCAQCMKLFAAPYDYEHENFPYESWRITRGNHGLVIKFGDEN